MLVLSQTAPQDMMEIVPIPLLCFIIGLAVWSFALSYEKKTEKGIYKWLAFVPLGIGLIYGAMLVANLSDYLYIRMLPSKKVIYSHYFALILPILGIAFLLIAHFRAEHKKRHWYEY
jgi:4-amino-4-deoxy-L-arabinose transferase-like glycosyltransferase